MELHYLRHLTCPVETTHTCRPTLSLMAITAGPGLALLSASEIAKGRATLNGVGPQHLDHRLNSHIHVAPPHRIQPCKASPHSCDSVIVARTFAGINSHGQNSKPPHSASLPLSRVTITVSKQCCCRISRSPGKHGLILCRKKEILSQHEVQEFPKNQND